MTRPGFLLSRRKLLARGAGLVGALALAGCSTAGEPTPRPTDRSPVSTEATRPPGTAGPLATGPAPTVVVGVGTPTPDVHPTPTVAPTPAPTATPTVAPTATPAERPLHLVLGERNWTLTVRAGTLVGLGDLLRTIAGEVGRPARDARLRIKEDGTLEFTPAAAGVALDAAESAGRVQRAATEGQPSVELATRPVAPALADEQFAGARARLEKILGYAEGPIVTVRAGERSWTLDRAETAALLAMDFPRQPGGVIAVVLDEWPTRELILRLARALDREPVAARFAWNGGKLKVIREPGAGVVLDREAAYARFARALPAAERVLELPMVPVAPAVTAADAERFVGATLIESGSTPLAGAIPEKKANVRLAAERLNGTVVPAGGTFSFNKEVGPTTLEAGYQWGFGITSGAEGIRTVPSVAGGICQVSTTLFQAVYWAGYALEERYWHLYWIPSYESRGVVGLDVTVDEAARLDFKWVNTTRDPVLVQAAADDEKVTFQLYGKKPAWRVEVEPAKIANRVPPDTTPFVEEDPNLPWGRTIAIEAAREGFEVEVVRRVTPADGSAPRVLHLRSNYQPSRTVTLVGTAGRPVGSPTPGAAAPRVAPGQTPSPATNRPANSSTPQPREQNRGR